MNYILPILIFAVYAGSSSTGLIVLKMAMSEKPVALNTLFDLLLSPKFIFGFAFYVIGFVTWMYILSKYKLNFAFPIAISLFFILTGLGSYLILKEPFTILQGVGVAFCLVGIMLIVIK